MIAFSILGAFTLFAGCASDEIMSAADDGGVVDAAAAADAGKKDVAAPGCIAHCTRNEECANSCPTSSGSSHCCDIGSGKCYAFASAACPADVVVTADGGVTPPY
jgi:hypothetical protein